MSRQKPRLARIADALGVSTATVSNALSGKGRVSPELAERIRATAAELGYVPSVAGRALRTGRSGVLGLVLADISNPLFPKLAQAIENSAAKAGYGVLIADSHGDVTAQTQAIERLIERGVDGMIVVPRRGTWVTGASCPVAVIDSPSTPGNTVAADHWSGGVGIGLHLYSLGHKHVLLLGNSTASNVQNDRLGGVRSGLGSARVETVWIEKLEAQSGQGCSLGLAEAVARGVTAIAAVSDLVALRALTELQRAGIAVPEDVSVTGFDDLIWSSVITPGLTTMRMDVVTIADIAISAVLDAINRPQSAEKRRGDGETVIASQPRVPMEMVVRQSTGPVKKPAYPNDNKTDNLTAGELMQ